MKTLLFPEVKSIAELFESVERIKDVQGWKSEVVAETRATNPLVGDPGRLVITDYAYRGGGHSFRVKPRQCVIDKIFGRAVVPGHIHFNMVV